MENIQDNNASAVQASEQLSPQEHSIPEVIPSEEQPNISIVTPSTVTPTVTATPAVIPSAPVVTRVVPTTPSVVPSGVEASCGCNSSNSSLVFAIGSIGVDFGTDAILDSFKFYMRGYTDEHGNSIQYPDPYNPKQLVKYLKDGEPNVRAGQVYDSARVIWTISQNGTPIYAVRPEGSFSETAYDSIIEFLRPFEGPDDTEGPFRIDLCSFPGHITDSVKLRSGQVVPVITPNLRAMYNWRVQDLCDFVIDMIKNDPNETEVSATTAEQDLPNKVERLANRLTFELQNFGTSSADRALNHTATNLYNVGAVIGQKLKEGYELDSFKVQKSDICRPDSDCQDVLVTFFNPSERLEKARHVYRFTVDVSKVIPVSIGSVRDWYEY